MRSVFFEWPDPEELRGYEARLGGVRSALWVWLPAAIALVVIACESTDTFSAAHTSTWLRPVFERIFGHITDAGWELTHHLFRKSGHFGGFGLVCLMLLRAWLITLATRRALGLWGWRGSAAGLALLCTSCVASLDEWHQTFIPSRTGRFADVVLDTSGAAVMCAVVALFCWRAQKPIP